MPANDPKPINVNPESISELIGRSSSRTVRYGRDMNGLYAVDAAPESVIYEVYELESVGHLKLAMTIMKPGKAGDEYYMTKGHFHEDERAGEVYFGLKGRGLILIQTKDGQTEIMELVPGAAVSIPPGWAHRSVNVGDEDLVFLAIYPTTAGHDYAAIEKYGFMKRVVEREGRPQVI